MKPDEQNLDMLVAEPNRKLRARNERLTAENEALEKQVKELRGRLAQPQANGEH
jgi:cell division protein FtsB